MNTKAQIITIGDEILYGQTLDTNSHWISGELAAIGISLTKKITIPDNEETILEAFEEAQKSSQIVFITGGLGPTNDDLTKPCLAKFVGVELEMNQEALKDVETLFAARGRELNQLNKNQGLMPKGATKITNKVGTAPGIWIKKGDTIYISMPGVPHEMKKMMTDIILPRIKEDFNDELIIHQFIRTGGIPESRLAEKLETWEESLPQNIKLAYLPTLGQVKLRLTARGQNKEELEKQLKTLVSSCLDVIGKYVYSLENIGIEERIGQMLKEQDKTIACAESCTGGYISHMLTSVPGSSAYFMGSHIPYSYKIKENILNIDGKTLLDKGAVSEEVIIQMAENIRTQFGTDVGVATSGIAGPGGGSDDKPVGTVWIAVSTDKETITRKYVFAKERALNIQLSSLAALNMVKHTLDN